MTREFQICILVNCIVIILSMTKKMFENYISKCYKVKRILISFNCFSEYIIAVVFRARSVSVLINMVHSYVFICSISADRSGCFPDCSSM